MIWGKNTGLARLWRSNKIMIRIHLAQLSWAEQSLNVQYTAGDVTLRRAPCQESEPHRVLPEGWSISDMCHSHFWLRLFLDMPMKRMCVCQLDEAPVEKPHPSPFLRSLSLEFGNSLECWARAGEQSCRLSQRRVLGLWRETFEGRGRML